MGGLRIDTDSDERVITPRGRLSPSNSADLRMSVHKHLVDWVDVLVDVGGLRVDDASAVHTFPTALAEAGGWPLARLVLFGADAALADVLQAERVPSVVPLARDLAAARPLLGRRPERITRCHELPCDLAACAHARALVTSACADWGVANRYPDATLVTTELVTNAVVHARTTSALLIGLDRYGLHIAVRDRAPEGTAGIRSAQKGTAVGRGLHLVAELTRVWGVSPHPDGKTVWTVLGPR